MNKHLLKFCGLIVSLFFFSNMTFAQANIECRQPVSTVVTPGECGNLDLIVLPPFLLNDFFDLSNVVISNDQDGNDFLSGGDYEVGTTVVEWTVTDGANTETCESLVIVEDNELPTVGPCSTIISYTGYNCQAGVLVDSEISDNCGIQSIQGLGLFVMAPGLYEHPIIVTDLSGNVYMHTEIIQVHDDRAPEFINCPTSALSLDPGPDGTVDYPLPAPIATDNCGATTVTDDIPEGGFPIGESLVTFTASDDYGNLTLCEVTLFNGVLPVSFGDFDVDEKNEKMILDWTTENERNNSGFEVQFSVNATDWETIGFVEGEGDSDREVSYSFTHENPVLGKNNYRLKQIDFDGKLNYSSVITEVLDREDVLIQVSPNPVRDFLRLTLPSGQFQMSIMNSQGKLMQQVTVENGRTIDLSNFNSGIYFVRVENEMKVQDVIRVVKL